jgi:PhnB protein
MDFLIKAFDGLELERMFRPDGSVMHGEIRIGNSVVMIGGAMEGAPARETMIYLYMEDCDKYFDQAIELGAEVVSELADQFYGDRHGAVRDSNGNVWYIATHKEDLTPEEMKERMANMS